MATRMPFQGTRLGPEATAHAFEEARLAGKREAAAALGKWLRHTCSDAGEQCHPDMHNICRCGLSAARPGLRLRGLTHQVSSYSNHGEK